MNKLEPITKEMHDNISNPFEKFEAKKEYHKWLKEVRKQDKSQVKKEWDRIYNFLRMQIPGMREKMKEYKREKAKEKKENDIQRRKD